VRELTRLIERSAADELALRLHRTGWCLGAAAFVSGVDLLHKRREPAGVRWMVEFVVRQRGLVLSPAGELLPVRRGNATAAELAFAFGLCAWNAQPDAGTLLWEEQPGAGEGSVWTLHASSLRAEELVLGAYVRVVLTECAATVVWS
jgi:hypothetical protein